VGVEPPPLPEEALEAAPPHEVSPHRRGSTPIPTLPPSRGKGVSALAALLLIGAAPLPPGALETLDAQRQARAVARDADRARAQDAAAQIARLRAQLIALGGQESSGQRRAGGARAALERLNLQEAELKARMGHNQESLTKLLGALQMYARNPPPPLLVDPRSARDAVRAAILIKAITPELEGRAQTFTAASNQLKRVRRDEDVQSGALFQAESGVAEREAEIADLITQKQALEKQLYADADAADGEARRLAARARSLGELVTVVDARRDGGAAGDAGLVRLAAPVQGALTRGFGQPGGDPERARGVTWTAAANASVLSPAAAVVDYAGPLKGWGDVLILQSGGDRMVLAGLGEVGTEAGRTVESGEPIGKMPGDTPHPTLYLEVRRAGRPVDPGRWLGAPAQAAG
jgi:murein hydrolase activator